ncbi:hypothetical protein CkaCkLH20_12768 [Colletotrichum karsti]|uniref:F-box domain-containing protein n=1 Tax=Colletotrichum karsti TaxID=1095194 RepID=A0A9P6I0N8_9PEZI|nr:uncharacterized protein CkaCkLH20_12768 [Colletotrichum karsti]KAF9869725.1 hypothetical protein CkaCkLH20_12768 [Colletotrichum karsti]
MNAPETISNGLTSSTFSKIPLDVLLNILDELDLGDLFFFSQTCRTVRGLTHKDWPSAIAGNDPQQRRQRTNFWAILAYQLPRHWVCEACTKLHVIRRVQSFNHGDLRCDSNFKSADMKVPSRIMHAYVQMALKLSRPENHYSACYDGRTTLVRAWYDFGAYSSPEDITWKAHVDRDHILYHEPGSIREKWEEREEVGGRDGTANPSSSAGVGKSYPCHRGDEVDDFATAIMGLGLDDEL